MTSVVRTPEERFVDLPGFPYDPVYIDDLKGFEGLRMHPVRHCRVTPTNGCAINGQNQCLWPSA